MNTFLCPQKPPPFQFTFVANKIPKQNNCRPTKSQSKKSIPNLNSSASYAPQYHSFLSPLPDLLPFLSSNKSSIPALHNSTFSLNAPKFCSIEGTLGLIAQAGSVDLPVEDDGDSSLMDEYYPLGEISCERVRLTIMDHKARNGYFSQPVIKKMKVGPSLCVDSCLDVATPVSDSIESMVTSDGAMMENGISSDGFTEENSGHLLKKQSFMG